MNKYLVKIAKEQKKEGPGWGKTFGVMTLTGVPTALAAGKLTTMANVGMNRDNQKRGFSDGHTMRKFVRDNKLNVSFTHNKVDASKIVGANREFSSEELKDLIRHNDPAFAHRSVSGMKKDFITGGHKVRNADVLMHELGHAKDYMKLGKTKALARGIASKMLYHPVGSAGTSAVALAALHNEDTAKYAPAVYAVPHAVILRDEIMANVHAYKGIKAHKGSKAAMGFAKKLAAKNMVSYGAQAAGMVGGVALAAHLLHRKKGVPTKDE